MSPNATRNLILLATAFSGFLAGASADRYVVQVPAWRHLDVMTWAEHSRHADLGNGRFWYPLLAFAATGLSIAAAVGVYTRLAVTSLPLPIYLAAASELAGLSLTILAAPNLIRLRKPQDRVVTARGFQLVHVWGLPRAGFQIAAFPILLWAVSVLLRSG